MEPLLCLSIGNFSGIHDQSDLFLLDSEPYTMTCQSRGLIWDFYTIVCLLTRDPAACCICIKDLIARELTEYKPQ